MSAVLVETIDRIAWVTLNRPERRNAMNPRLNAEMIEVLDAVAADDEAGVLVLTGAGPAFSAGMDLKEFFADLDHAHPSALDRARRDAFAWQYERLRFFPKPTIAMVNGWCLGGAFTPLISCDIAVAADDAVFGLSEVNWGILPGGVVTRDLADALTIREAMYRILTGRTFTGREAQAMGLVTLAVPAERLRAEVTAIAAELLTKNPAALRAAKQALRHCADMNWPQARDYLYAKYDQLRSTDPEHGRDRGLEQFLAGRYKPGLTGYLRDQP